MDNSEEYVLYLAPMVAVLFFFLLAILSCCYYNNRPENKDENKKQLNDAQVIAVETKERSHSAVDDYFVVMHL